MSDDIVPESGAMTSTLFGEMSLFLVLFCFVLIFFFGMLSGDLNRATDLVSHAGDIGLVAGDATSQTSPRRMHDSFWTMSELFRAGGFCSSPNACANN
jgi:hypothetical protein